MTTSTVHAPPAVLPAAPAADRARLVADTLTSARRILLAYRRSPGLLVASLAVPVLLVVVFGYVLGSAMTVPGSGYREFLMPGLFVLVAFNGLMPTMVGAARDSSRGIADRMRSMPVSRTGFLLGQCLADALVGAVVLVPLSLVGLAAGWRIRDGLAPALAAYGLLMLFRAAMTWVGYYLGLTVGSEEVAGQLSALTFPVAMLTNAFVPTGGMPAWLRVICEWNPVSAMVAACRRLFGNGGIVGAAWPLQHPVAAAVGWSLLLIVVFAPLAVRRFSVR